ncbi:MAG: hypothetical protein H8E32_04585 [Nitrospinae bacterium]|nr:hypothetical protein [Nitrospinota bacterium]
MQCPECSYISFKIEKACGACGFKFKKGARTPSLAGKESFSLFSGAAVQEQKKTEDSPEVVGVLDEQEPESFIDSETGDFNLNLAEIQEEKEEIHASSDSESTDYESLEFDPDADIDLGDEVEGLGLEPLLVIDEPKTEETSTTLDTISVDEDEDILIVDESPAESIETSNEELVIGEPDEEPVLEIGEPALEIDEPDEEPVLEIGEPEEPALSIEPELEISEPDEEPVLEIGEPEEPTLSVEPALEISEPDEESVLEIGEPEEPALSDEPAVEISEPNDDSLDLGDSEIKLDLGYEPPPSNDPDPAALAAHLDELDLNLEIDDSDGPLNTQNKEIPDIEIEDLGLELESPDEPDKDKP